MKKVNECVGYGKKYKEKTIKNGSTNPILKVRCTVECDLTAELIFAVSIFRS